MRYVYNHFHNCVHKTESVDESSTAFWCSYVDERGTRHGYDSRLLADSVEEALWKYEQTLIDAHQRELDELRRNEDRVDAAAQKYSDFLLTKKKLLAS